MKLKAALPTVFAAMLVAVQLFASAPTAERAPRRIEVTAKRFEFTPGQITLKKGEPVVLVLTSADIPHGIRFKELGVEGKVGKGEPARLPLLLTRPVRLSATVLCSADLATAG